MVQRSGAQACGRGPTEAPWQSAGTAVQRLLKPAPALPHSHDTSYTQARSGCRPSNAPSSNAPTTQHAGARRSLVQVAPHIPGSSSLPACVPRRRHGGPPTPKHGVSASACWPHSLGKHNMHETQAMLLRPGIIPRKSSSATRSPRHPLPHHPPCCRCEALQVCPLPPTCESPLSGGPYSCDSLAGDSVPAAARCEVFISAQSTCVQPVHAQDCAHTASTHAAGLRTRQARYMPLRFCQAKRTTVLSL